MSARRRPPSNSWIADPYYYWDWPGRPDRGMLAGNGGHVLSSELPAGSLAGKLIVPDSESQTGWRDHWVIRESPSVKPRRMGFS